MDRRFERKVSRALAVGALRMPSETFEVISLNHSAGARSFLSACWSKPVDLYFFKLKVTLKIGVFVRYLASDI